MNCILFDGNKFNKFPINLFVDYIIYVNYKFRPMDNKEFLKKVIVKGIKLIYITNNDERSEKRSQVRVFDLIIKVPELAKLLII